jgi:RNA polymerase sigma-70 factor (ECF subfamily)
MNGATLVLFRALRQILSHRIMSDAVHIIGTQLVAFLPNMRRFALSLCRSAAQADDIVQLACERALANATSFQVGTRFDAWIFRIIRNLWIDQMRRDRTAGPHQDISDVEDTIAGSDERTVEARLVLGKVWDAIGALPADQREVMILVCVEEFSYREAAETLEVPIGTVMSRLARARQAIARAVGINGAGIRSDSSKEDS